MADRPALLDVVALLRDRPEAGIVAGQVGTVVEELDRDTVLVEFTDDAGRAYRIVAIPRPVLLVLRYAPVAA